MAEILAAGTALGVASSIITICDVSWRVMKRIKEYSDTKKHVPAILHHIDAQLPALIEKVEELKRSQIGGNIGTKTALGKAVITCEKQIKLLDDLTARILLDSTDSRLTQARKAISSVWHEENLLGASYFFSRGQSALASAEGLVTTIARQLARVARAFEDSISLAISKSPNIAKQNPREQWKMLIMEPLAGLDSAVTPSGTLV